MSSRLNDTYDRSAVIGVEDCLQVLDLLSYTQDGAATNYESLQWNKDNPNRIIVKIGNKEAILQRDVQQATDSLISMFNTHELTAYVRDEIRDMLPVIKDFYRVNITNVPIVIAGMTAPIPHNNVLVYSPDAFSAYGSAPKERPILKMIHWIAAGTLSAFLEARTAAGLIEKGMQNGEQFEIQLSPAGEFVPKRFCRHCATEIAIDAAFCPKCGTPQQAAAATTPRMTTPPPPPMPDRWEFCEVVWDGKKSGAGGVFNVALKAAFDSGNPFGAKDSHIKFWVKVSSPRGDYSAGATDWMSAPGYPDQRNRNHVQALEQLVSNLLQDGWEPVGQGEGWYNVRLRRRFRG